MGSIITVTMSPAVDVTLEVKKATDGDVMTVERETRQSAGKGVNLSMALLKRNVKSTAIVLLGRDGADDYLSRLSDEGLDCTAVECDGRVRENVTIEGDVSLKLNRRAQCNNGDVKALGLAIEKRVSKESITVFAGSLPNGAHPDAVVEMLMIAKKGRLVIDSHSLSLPELIKIKPDVIAPNVSEFAALVNIDPTENAKELADRSKALLNEGIGAVMITMGAKGILYVDRSGAFLATPPKVDAKNTVGAGDSALAGLSEGMVRGLDARECVRLAAAYGTASVTTHGTGLQNAALVNELLEKTKVSCLL